MVSDASTSTSAHAVHPMAFVYAANHHHHHRQRDGGGAGRRNGPARRMRGEDEGALASAVGVGGVVDPSAYERVTSGNPFGDALLTTPAAATASARGGASFHPRVLLPTMDAAVYVNAKQYNAILRRRKARAKEAAKAAERSTAREVSGRGVAKYASRSAHAKNRVRGKDGKYLTRAELLAGLGGPEAKARAEAREVEIAERAAKKKAREEKRERKAREKAALRASRVASAAVPSASAAPAPAPATTTVAV